MDVLELSKNLDLVAASELQKYFLQKRSQELLVDAGQVQKLGGQCLQILLAAKRAWEVDCCDFTMQNPSETFLEALALMGTSVDELTYHVSPDC